MIVKNEQDIVRRSLTSALPYVDHWCIVDTGSTDETKGVIAATCAAAHVPGRLYSKPWVNFGVNRTQALRLARKSGADWLLMMDADDIFHSKARIGDMLTKPMLDFAGVLTPMKTATVTFRRIQLFNAKAPWVYKGALHEYPEMEKPETPGPEPKMLSMDEQDLFIEARCEGVRSKDPHKYLNDAKALDAVCAADPDDTRSMFYAAQSWRDAGHPEEALPRYLKRSADSRGFREEQYVSFWEATRLEPDIQLATRYAWAAMHINPLRREATTARMLRMRTVKLTDWTQELFAMGWATACISSPTVLHTFLFAVDAVYAWMFADEFSVVCFRMGHTAIGLPFAKQAAARAPDAEKARIGQNITVAEQALAASPNKTSPVELTIK